MSSTATAILVSALLIAIIVLQVAYTHVVTRRDRSTTYTKDATPNIDVHVHVQLPEGLQVAPVTSPDQALAMEEDPEPVRSIEQALADAVVADVAAEEPAPEPPFVPSPLEQAEAPPAPVAPEPEATAPAKPPVQRKPTTGHRETMERRERAILACVAGYPTGISDKQIAKEVGAPESSVKRSVKKLHGQGKLTLVREGVSGGGGRSALWGPKDAAPASPPVAPESEPAAPPTPAPAKGKRTPPAAQLERVPEELAGMPAVAGMEQARRSQITSAQKQLAVLTFVKSRTTVVPAEVHAAMPEIAQATISGYLRELAAAGLIRLTGRGRYAKGQKRGKGGLEYAPAEGEGRAKDAMARDYARSVGRPFTQRELALGCVISVRDAGEELKKLLEKGVVRSVTDGEDTGKFVYVKPDGPGRAAELDAAARKSAAPPANGNGGGEAVAGTGKGVKANNKDVQALIDDCVRAGASVAHATNGHFAVHKKGMERRILISATPSNPRSVLNDRARLRRAGLPV